MKQYKLVHLSFDYLALNKTLVTNAALYTFIHEHWDEIGHYIVVSRREFGTDKEEIVRVVIRYD